MSRYLQTQKVISDISTHFDILHTQIDKLGEEIEKVRTARDWIRTDTAHKAPEQITVELLTSYITMIEGALE